MPTKVPKVSDFASNAPLTNGPDPRRVPGRCALPEGGGAAEGTRAVPMRELGGERDSTYRAPQSAKQGSVARCGPVPVVRPDGTLRDTDEGDGLRDL